MTSTLTETPKLARKFNRLVQKTDQWVDPLAHQIAQSGYLQLPLATQMVPHHEQINARLREHFLEMSTTIPDAVNKSPDGSYFKHNRWLSPSNLHNSSQPDLRSLMALIERLANSSFSHLGSCPLSIVSMWCFVGRTGLTGQPHRHAGNVAGVYYVDAGSANRLGSGTLQFLPTWRQYAVLGQYQNAADLIQYINGRPAVQPQSGRLLLFPSQLEHSVHRYVGSRERIAISFNLR